MTLPCSNTLYSIDAFRLVLFCNTMSHRYQWLWTNDQENSLMTNRDHCWQKYSDVENDIIENAYHDKQEHIELDDYIIDLKKFVQINKSHTLERYPIKRISGEDVLYSRIERLVSSERRSREEGEDNCK